MKLNKQQITLLIVVVLVGWLFMSASGNRYASEPIQARSRGVELPESWAPAVRFVTDRGWTADGRDVFEAPTDVSPMPKLALAAPPLDPPPIVWPLPVPASEADRLAPLRHLPRIRSSEEEEEDEAAEDDSQDSGAVVAPPVAQDRPESVEPARVYDAIVRSADGSTTYGWILNENKFDLEAPSRRSEPIRFEHVRQGRTMAIDVIERDKIREFRFAPTVPNLYEIKKREFEPTPGNVSRVAALAEWCFEQAPSNPVAYEFAIEQFRVLLGIDRADKGQAYRGLARVYRAQYDVEKEMAVFSEGVEKGVTSPSLMVDFGDLYERLGLPEAAEAIYRGLVEKDSFDKHGRLALGRLLVRTGRAALAGEHLEAAASASLEGEQIKTLAYWQGRRRLAIGDLEGAQTAFRQVIQLGESEPQGYAGLAATLLVAGDASGARQQIERGLERCNDDAALRLNRALVAIRLDEADLAAADLVRSARLDPMFGAPVEIVRGYLSELDGDQLEAREHYDNAVAMAPENPMAHYHLGRVLRAAGDDSSAFTALTASLSLEWRLYEVVHELAYLTYELGQYDEARRFIEKALEREPGSHYLLVLAGLIALRQGRLEAADAYFDRVPEEQQNATIQAARAISYYEQGNSGEARNLLARTREQQAAQGDAADLPRLEYAEETLRAIEDNESKEQWIDDFNRRQLTKGWEAREPFGVRVVIDEGKVLFQGQQDNLSEGLTLLSREELGRALVAFEATFRLDDPNARFRNGLLLQIRRPGRRVEDDRWAELGFARGPKGDLQTYLRRNHKTEQDWTSLPEATWPTEGPVTLRIERPDPDEPMFELSVNGEKVGEVEFSSMKSYSLGIHLAVFSQAGLTEKVKFVVDRVRIIRRKG